MERAYDGLRAAGSGRGAGQDRRRTRPSEAAGQLTRRRALAQVAAGVGLGLPAAVLGACRAPDASPAQGTTSRAPVKVTYMGPLAAGTERHQLEQELFQSFGEPGKGTSVDVLSGPGGWPQLREKFIVSHAGGDPIDLVQNAWGSWTDMAEGGMFTELMPLFKRDKVSLDIFTPVSVEAYTAGDKLWGMPVSISADALAYNLDLFDAAGLPYPPVNPEDKSWTMERFQEYAVKLTRAGEQFGFGGASSGFSTGGVSDGTYFQQLAWDDKRRKSLMDTTAFRQGLQFWHDLETKLHVQPSAEEAAAIRGGSTANIFLSGKIGMQVILTIFPREQAAFRWGLATLPSTGPGRNMSARMWPSGLHIGRSPRAEQAWEVLKWLTRPENGGRFPLTAGHAASPLVKGGSDLAQKLRQEQSGVDPKAWVLQSQYSPLSASGMLKYASWPKVAEEIDPKYKAFRAQQLAVGDFARQASEAIDRLMP
ncbi:MAG TPA: extracellular solute-binding protein [Chloroflexota bacterium]|nr:extracellular solute-binding protein [Chloroflexota bacterium]